MEAKKQVSVRLPENLQEKILEEAETRGITVSEKIRLDLIKKYYD